MRILDSSWNSTTNGFDFEKFSRDPVYSRDRVYDHGYEEMIYLIVKLTRRIALSEFSFVIKSICPSDHITINFEIAISLHPNKVFWSH